MSKCIYLIAIGTLLLIAVIGSYLVYQDGETIIKILERVAKVVFGVAVITLIYRNGNSHNQAVKNAIAKANAVTKE
jgi:hypothetical protein